MTNAHELARSQCDSCSYPDSVFKTSFDNAHNGATSSITNGLSLQASPQGPEPRSR
jgi:hypothetical protein